MAPAIGIAAMAHAQAGFRPRFLPQPPFAIAIGEDAGRQAMALADLNGDQRPDLVAIEPTQHRVVIRLNDGDGGFGAPQSVTLDGLTPTAAVVGDVTSPFASVSAGRPDGIPDLLIGSDSHDLVIAAGFGDGNFETGDPIAPDGASRVIGLAVGEFDAVAGADVAILSPAGVQLLCNSGFGPLSPCGDLIPVGDDPIEIVSGDFNGDAHADLAVLDRADQRVLPLIGNGDGTFITGTLASVSGEASGSLAIDMAVGDVDGDGLDDLVIANRNEFLQFIAVTLLGTSRGSFRARAFVIDFDATALAIGDFDNGDDGALDVLVGYSGTNRGGATVNIGDATGVFADPFAPVGTNTLGRISLLLSGDLNGDGITDVVTASGDGDTARVLLNRTQPFCAGDCNADGTISIDELMRGVIIVLGEGDTRDCVGLDTDGNLDVTIDELVAAVAHALVGCPTS